MVSQNSSHVFKLHPPCEPLSSRTWAAPFGHPSGRVMVCGCPFQTVSCILGILDFSDFHSLGNLLHGTFTSPIPLTVLTNLQECKGRLLVATTTVCHLLQFVLLVRDCQLAVFLLDELRHHDGVFFPLWLAETS